MSELSIYRKRLIPEECVLLKDDLILSRDDNIILTRWNAIRTRSDLTHGYSCYYLQRDIKVSRFFNADGPTHWYCDIVDYAFNETGDVLTVTDLLADVAVLPGDRIRVLDLDELADAFDHQLLDAHLLKKSLHALDRLLNELYNHGIDHLAAPIERAIRKEQGLQ